MNKLRVLHVISRMNAGGTATYLNELIPSLNKIGIESHLVFGDTAPGELEDLKLSSELATKFKSLGRSISPISDFKSIRMIKKLTRTFMPHIIHSHAFKGGLISRAWSDQKIKRIHTFHGHHLYDPEFSRLAVATLNLTEKILSKYTDGYIFVGAKVQSELNFVGIGQIKPSISIAPGTNIPKLIPRQQALDAINLRALRENSLKVLWMGRFVEVKQPEAVLRLAGELPNIDFILAGDGPLKGQLMQSAPINVHFVGWRDRDLLLSLADILMSTSKSEGMPLSLIEAQLSGIPVVAPNVGSISEIVVDRETGFLINANLSDLFEKITSLVENPSLLHSFSRSAEKQALSKFSVEKLVTAHANFYERVLSC